MFVTRLICIGAIAAVAISCLTTSASASPLSVTRAIEFDPLETSSSAAPPHAIYMLTVRYDGKMPLIPVMLVLTDKLPTNVVIENSDFDGAGPQAEAFAFTPGQTTLSLGPDDVSYSSDEGMTFSYVPKAGADLNVRAIRIAPRGAMLPGSSFTIRFRILETGVQTALFEVYDSDQAVLRRSGVGGIAGDALGPPR